MNDNILVKIDRDSVCFADDTENHTMCIYAHRNTTLIDLFRKMIEERYFPQIFGNDVVWVLTHDDKDYIAWVTKDNKYIANFINASRTINLLNNINETNIKFVYYSSTNKRAEYIYKACQDNKMHSGYEAYIEELKHYNISVEVENG